MVDHSGPGLPRWRRALRHLESGLEALYFTRHRQAVARAHRDEEDLFMLLVMAQTLGVPNPAACYTLELLPVVYDRFHDWHRRMGMERSPLDHVSCC
ncbi:MAG: cory-CC-star protein [Pseudomonadales bacterium]